GRAAALRRHRAAGAGGIRDPVPAHRAGGRTQGVGPPRRSALIDSHCHLCDRRFDRDRVHVLDRARAAGVTHFVEIAYAPEILPRAQALAAEHAYVFLCLGVHRSESGRVPDDYLATLRDQCGHARVVAVGETGLDFYRDGAPRADQERWFRAQIALADQKGLPVVIHQRSALADTLAILEETRPAAGGVLHCFD